MENIPEMAFEEISGRDGHLGLITLQRQSVLNALDQKMINALDQQLVKWETANHIKAVIVRAAEGRAFCVGGDIRSVYERKLKNDSTMGEFFCDEYRMNSRIRHYSKPYIALLNGITMGGGVGISVHGSHRIATEKLLWAMPETAIGFYPDVGTTYVLARMPHNIGFYLGLSGARIGLADCMAAGLVDYSLKEEQFSELIYALADTEFQSDASETVTQIIKKFSMPVDVQSAWPHGHIIEDCFNKKTVEEIFKALEKEKNPWCQEVLSNLKTKSPTSLKVTLAALQQALKLDFNDAIQMECCISSHFLAGHDFFEGIRAVVIDKDQSPRWRPAQLKDVKKVDIEKYFIPIRS